MNQSLEDQLRQLRPGPLTPKLREALAAPPDLTNDGDATDHWHWWRRAVGAAAAVAVATVAILLMRDDSTSLIAGPLMSSRSERLVDARCVAVVDDGSRRAWEIVELEFIDQETIVGGRAELAMETRSTRRQFVPVEIYFD